MLQSIRDHSQGWLTTVIMSIVVIAFGLWGIHSYLGTTAQPTTMAKVNKYVIQQAEFNTAYERLRSEQQMQLGADFIIDQKMEAALKKRALDQLIMGQLLQQAATKDGYRVSVAEVYVALAMIPAFQVNGQFSTERFKEALNEMLYTEKTFLDDLQTTMLVNQVHSGFVESTFSLPSEVDTAIKLVNQKRDIGYLIIPLTRFNNTIQISDAEAAAYYNQHQTQFVTPEQVSVEYLELSLPQLANQLHFSDAQLQQFYQNNISSYTRPQRWHIADILIKVPVHPSSKDIAAAKAKINSLLARARSGESFAKLAAENSEDTASAKKGGELDWFSPGMADPQIEKVVNGLKVGEISAPIQTKYGFSIVQLLAVEQPQVSPFDKVRAQVVKAIAQQQADKLFADASDKLSNLTYANPASLDVAAKALGIQVKGSGLFGRTGGKDAITSNPKVYAAAFSADVLQGNNSEVIELDPETQLVLHIKQHKAAALMPFSAVRDQVVAQLKTQAEQQQAQALGEQILASLAAGKNIHELAQKANLTWNETPDAKRFGEHIPTTLLNTAFRMPRPTTANPFSSLGLKMPNGDYAVLMVSGVHDGVPPLSATDNQIRIYQEQLERNYGQMDYALYVRGLIHKSKVVIDKKNLNSPSAS